MTSAVQIAMAVGSVRIVLALMAVVRHMAGLWQLGPEVQRKLVHIGTGLYALILRGCSPTAGQCICCAA